MDARRSVAVSPKLPQDRGAHFRSHVTDAPPTERMVCSNGSQALTGHYLVDILPQFDMPSVEEHFVASGRQVLPLVAVANLEPGDILGVGYAPLMCVPLDAMQYDSRPPDLSSDPPAGTPISAAATTASRSPALLECLTPEQRA